MQEKSKVSILIPVYNEEIFISNMLRSIVEQTINIPCEIFIIDGNSSDRTLETIKKFSSNSIRVLSNKDRYKPYALNLGIQHASGEYILIADAHSWYPPNYISTLINFMDNNPDYMNAGCPFKTHPGSSSEIADAIALALTSKFAVGNSYHRIGINRTIEADTVPFGCFRRKIFELVGLFDTDLIVNEDDEMNSRIIKYGFKIALLPFPFITYYSRENIKALAIMMYKYGKYKPLTLQKIGYPTSIRQLIPPLFVFSLFCLFPLSYYDSLPLEILLIAYVIFLTLATIEKINAIKKKKRVSIFLFYFISNIIVIHIFYGLGYLTGITNLLKTSLKRLLQKTGY